MSVQYNISSKPSILLSWDFAAHWHSLVFLVISVPLITCLPPIAFIKQLYLFLVTSSLLVLSPAVLSMRFHCIWNVDVNVVCIRVTCGDQQ